METIMGCAARKQQKEDLAGPKVKKAMMKEGTNRLPNH
jgi:hypothetical protein